jgi:hypothetical protein
MMYQNKMVVCLKTKDGKVIREQGDEIRLPFGTEYSIHLKNLESRKAKVKIWVDGEDVLDGNSLLINPNSTLKLEGFMKGNYARNSFKFIEKTEEISEFRGDREDDGLIRLEFWYEKFKPITQEITYTYKWSDYPYSNTVTTKSCDSVGNLCKCTVDAFSSRTFSNTYDTVNYCNISNSTVNESGITVKGSTVNQEFRTGYIDELEGQSHTIILHLLGYKENQQRVEKVVTVKDKIQCSVCGKSSKSDAKFCSICGAFLD